MTRKPSLRAQWIIALGVAAVLIVALVVFVDRANQTAGQPAPPLNKSVVVTENHEADVLVTQDQAPHVAALRRAVAPAAGLRGAVDAYMAHQITLGLIDGPVERSSCRAARRGGSGAGRDVFTCVVEANFVNYPFDGVVAPAAHLITYCKRDLPPVPSMNIPVSARCT